jgi:ABC-2 type transport system ATP-binding protein
VNSNSPTSSNDFVTLRNVTKSFGNYCALNEVSLSIKEGEIFGYIGPNGAGKTTTMKILVGLISDFQGEVVIGGYKAPKNKEEIHKLLGYLPQNVAFQEWRTVNQTLKTFGKLSGVKDIQLEERIPKTLDLLGLADARHKRVSHLSGGMTQKVGLAQALLHEPKLLILDEPLNGLDPLSRRQFKDIVVELAKKGTTVLFSSHILSDVQDVANRVGIINRGRIKQVGNFNELKARLIQQKTVQVLLSQASDKWQELAAVKNVTDVKMLSPGIVVVNLEKDADEDQAVNEIVQSTVKLGIRIRGIWLVEPSLDQIYFNYIQEAEN